MNERLGSTEPDHEITELQKRQLVDRVREAVPYDYQLIDQFGAYETRFEHADGDGYTSIYIPVAADLQSEDNFIDDTVRIVNRREEIEAGVVLRSATTYGVHLTDMQTTYDHTIRAYDEQTGQPVMGTTAPQSVRELIETYDVRQAVEGPNILTAARLQEVEVLLDELDSTRRF